VFPAPSVLAAYVEALRIAEDRDDEDALEALLFAA
jgi:hypothetical protein